MGHVEAPQVELVPDALAGQQPGEPYGAGQRSSGVLPLALAAYQQQADPAAQPVEVVTVQVTHVVQRVVEVRLGAALAPALPGRGVVVAGEAHRQREEVGPLEREVGRVEGAQAAAQGGHLHPAAAVPVDPRDDLVEYPRLVAAVLARALFQRDVLVGPGGGVIAVDAVNLQPALVDQVRYGADHAVVLEVPGSPLLGRERQHRASPVAVPDDRARRADAVRPELGHLAAHRLTHASNSVRYGSNASRQAV